MGSKVRITETFTGGARMQISYFLCNSPGLENLWLHTPDASPKSTISVCACSTPTPSQNPDSGGTPTPHPWVGAYRLVVTVEDHLVITHGVYQSVNVSSLC